MTVMYQRVKTPAADLPSKKSIGSPARSAADLLGSPKTARCRLLAVAEGERTRELGDVGRC